VVSRGAGGARVATVPCGARGPRAGSSWTPRGPRTTICRHRGRAPYGTRARRPHTLSRSADRRSATVGSVRACAVTPLADVDGPTRTETNETRIETTEDQLRARCSTPLQLETRLGCWSIDESWLQRRGWISQRMSRDGHLFGTCQLVTGADRSWPVPNVYRDVRMEPAPVGSLSQRASRRSRAVKIWTG
jgi:hypothetical protein